MPQRHGVRVQPPCNPPKSVEIAPPAAACWRNYFQSNCGDEKGGGGGVRGLARDGTRWPSRRGDPSRPQPDGPGSGASPHCIMVERIAKTQRRQGAEKRILYWQFSASLRLCASAVAFGVGNEPVFAID